MKEKKLIAQQEKKISTRRITARRSNLIEVVGIAGKERNCEYFPQKKRF